MNRQAGYTLLELVVGLGIFVMVSALVTYASIDGWQALVTHRARTALVSELDEGTVRIEAFVRKATAFPDQATVGGQRYRAGSDTLILSLPAVDSDGGAIEDVSDTVVYTLRAEGIVELIAPAGGTRTTSDQLVVPMPSTVSFGTTNGTKPLVTATLTATRQASYGPLTRSVTVTALARNVP